MGSEVAGRSKVTGEVKGHLCMVSSCSFTMCASCWKMEPSSTMVASMFCMASARLWMYES